jgi:hypothetical protein
MIYYGPQTNISYDDSFFQPQGDEISVLQQHCGGENLVVFKGHLKPNGKIDLFFIRFFSSSKLFI